MSCLIFTLFSNGPSTDVHSTLPLYGKKLLRIRTMFQVFTHLCGHFVFRVCSLELMCVRYRTSWFSYAYCRFSYIPCRQRKKNILFNVCLPYSAQTFKVTIFHGAIPTNINSE